MPRRDLTEVIRPAIEDFVRAVEEVTRRRTLEALAALFPDEGDPATRALLSLGATRPEDVFLDTIIRSHIESVLRATQGNRSLAAKLLGIPRRTLQRMLRAHGR